MGDEILNEISWSHRIIRAVALSGWCWRGTEEDLQAASCSPAIWVSVPAHPPQASPELCSPGEGAGVKYSSGREKLSVSWEGEEGILG